MHTILIAKHSLAKPTDNTYSCQNFSNWHVHLFDYEIEQVAVAIVLWSFPHTIHIA